MNSYMINKYIQTYILILMVVGIMSCQKKKKPGKYLKESTLVEINQICRIDDKYNIPNEGWKLCFFYKNNILECDSASRTDSFFNFSYAMFYLLEFKNPPLDTILMMATNGTRVLAGELIIEYEGFNIIKKPYWLE